MIRAVPLDVKLVLNRYRDGLGFVPDDFKTLVEHLVEIERVEDGE